MDRAHPFETKNDLYYSDRGLSFNVATGCYAECLGLSCKKLLANSFRCSAARHCLLFFKKSAIILRAESPVYLRDLDGPFIFFTELHYYTTYFYFFY